MVLILSSNRLLTFPAHTKLSAYYRSIKGFKPNDFFVVSGHIEGRFWGDTNHGCAFDTALVSRFNDWCCWRITRHTRMSLIDISSFTLTYLCSNFIQSLRILVGRGKLLSLWYYEIEVMAHVTFKHLCPFTMLRWLNCYIFRFGTVLISIY